jgi:hypothetical protein
MSEKKCILILTADAGFGHRSAALAVQAALQKLTCEDLFKFNLFEKVNKSGFKIIFFFYLILTHIKKVIC